MPSNNDLAKRILKLEQRRQQQAAASNEDDEETIDYGPQGITMVYAIGDPNSNSWSRSGSGAVTKAQQLHIDQIESQLRAEAQAARCTQQWSLVVHINEDGSMDVSGPPWWPETPKSEGVGRGGFDAGRALAQLGGVGSRRYA